MPIGKDNKEISLVSNPNFRMSIRVSDDRGPHNKWDTTLRERARWTYTLRTRGEADGEETEVD
ncbi:hypothetical protein PIB30_028167 [Stylosanthes scabra]|uniref:Uncharacterized protein n=1 Tax=Stylosanthes scabra TaxID=79078 RepID=A0ABU6ZBD6_9FABA|nr:hypothetical protein [Stylosanthes scabra]